MLCWSFVWKWEREKFQNYNQYKFIGRPNFAVKYNINNIANDLPIFKKIETDRCQRTDSLHFKIPLDIQNQLKIKQSRFQLQLPFGSLLYIFAIRTTCYFCIKPNVENRVICLLTRTRRQETNYRGTHSGTFKQREKLSFW